MYSEIMLLVTLGLCSWFDIRLRKIPVAVLLVAVPLIGIGLGVQGSLSVERVGGALCICGILLGISVLTGGKIGIGDGLLIGLMQLTLGLQKNMKVLFVSFGVAFLIALILFVSRKADRKTTIPLAPILFFGVALQIGSQRF